MKYKFILQNSVKGPLLLPRPPTKEVTDLDAFEFVCTSCHYLGRTVYNVVESV